ncbi:DUF2867 domain-containing protein [Anaeromyxobacter diazotrophicus]|uniref:NAD(P)-dependent oxidoreductase n=1 Tax=Anaeromyxobacter diazotrophicus TaxID=2590199 RepID=A0A7I9VKV6_9BACT|nr:DUF2867 domain-containing protein [Anaeromyxobacter diazotrophicus]GEJ57025.1 NAD(P)-dependent oxidoreductase [Anaeromyxobacter diazotrophicus]
MRVLVTGATGYIGGSLVPRLLEAGHQVRVLARDPARVAGRRWAPQVEIARGDVLAPETLRPALAGCDAAYYLVHSMGPHARFDERDRAAAGHFAEAAEAARLGRIVYLGALGDERGPLSEHLASRHATGHRLREGAVPVAELRAAIVVGAGSISFEMVRCLTERLPVMICPRWVFQRVQPIAVRDVLAYLVAALTSPAAAGRVIEIGGADALTYRELMLGYAALRGLRRVLVPVPVLSPGLSSHWVHWMTPVPRGLARPLIEGLRSEVVVRDDLARRLFPEIVPLGYREALAEALSGLDRGDVQASWSDALATSQGDRAPVTLAQGAGLIVERRQREVAAAPADVFRAFSGLGGDRGWLYAGWAWRLRGALDRLLGGVGLRRGRRDRDELRAGDALDFWRVEEVQPARLLRLRAEMKVPGRAWLQFEVHPAAGGATRLVQTAFFAPRGLAGLAYWYLLYPIHALIFRHLIERVGASASAAAAERPG